MDSHNYEPAGGPLSDLTDSYILKKLVGAVKAGEYVAALASPYGKQGKAKGKCKGKKSKGKGCKWW